MTSISGHQPVTFMMSSHIINGWLGWSSQWGGGSLSESSNSTSFMGNKTNSLLCLLKSVGLLSARVWWVLLWLLITQIHVVTFKGGALGEFSSPPFVPPGGWLTGWLIVRGSAITNGLHLIFGSPTSVSVCLWRARDVVRWIRWGGVTHTHTQRLKALCVLLFSLYPGERWTSVGLSVGVGPSTQASVCCSCSANTAAAFLSVAESNYTWWELHANLV